ncbi:hypothetical protein Cadr_000007941 [Camelus dromedarius]|uniref:Uncharacterized protein n=1 Tax=Camelus dromedarius TaxID=9838 RepID=A0A5N4DZB4_CAMDR|nr:hypothetical protein Cadr_000007941 [Camelus dromedarius]
MARRKEIKMSPAQSPATSWIQEPQLARLGLPKVPGDGSQIDIRKLDLEVSEPIDFSSGDHQHLVQKAADSHTQSKSGRSYTASPSPGSREAGGNPHSKAKEREDTYVVQISEETTPEHSDPLPSPFSEAAVRRAFIVKVFLLLSVQLLVTGAIISMFIFW